MKTQVYFIGAGPGDRELITVKGKRVLARADVIIYADSLVNPALLRWAKKGAEVHGSAGMTLEEVRQLILQSVKAGRVVARVHSGDPSLYGALLEQIVFLREHGIEYAVIPGVSSVFAAAAALRTELTAPGISQTVIISRLAGRTPVPEDLRSLAAHHATLVLFLSVASIGKVVAELQAAGYPADTPVAVVYRVSWKDEKMVRSTLQDVAAAVNESGINKQALIMVGKVFSPDLKSSDFAASRLYDSTFSHGHRRATVQPVMPARAFIPAKAGIHRKRGKNDAW
ncbi:MAG: precorrin-4 C(11)-methyltransferase [Chloroflexi bacterium]|nr:precorrin-4 C(11)-methyltransferase [Chloroflexota bacterium]